MNYRHIYHAGNFADVLKHTVLALCLVHLKTKDRPFLMLDAHAGVGIYDLTQVEAQKTDEWRGGIGQLWGRDYPPALAPYMEVVQALNPDGMLRYYPGSPVLAQALLRPGDRLLLTELHPEDYASVALRFNHDDRVHVVHGDAYGTLKAHLPPPERRGLVLIDPPFEEKDEFARIGKGLGQALKRWPGGTYIVWYPIKARAPVDRALADLINLGLPPTLAVELMLRDHDDPHRLNGCGLLVLNPPWTLESTLADTLPDLTGRITDGNGAFRLTWAVPEA